MTSDRDPLVVSTIEACLHHSDLETLKHEQWVGDNILAFHAEWLGALSGQLSKEGAEPQAKMLPPSVVELLCTLHDASAADTAAVVPKPSERYLLLPVSDRYSPVNHGYASHGSHWSLLVVDSAKAVGYHLDSLGDINRTAANAVHGSIVKLSPTEIGRKITTVEPRTVDCLQHQENGSDCGIYVLLLSSLLHRHLSSPNTQDLDSVVNCVCTEVTPDRVGRFRQSYLDWLQAWGEVTRHREHSDPTLQIKARFLRLFSDLGVE